MSKIAENKYRSVDLGSLRMSDVGKEVTLSGWVNDVRKLGGLTFATLRDMYGITQVIFKENEEVSLNKEDVVCVKGKVLERESKNPN
ncbi:MAG: OB-fold nucleic acid binding domain-containing protein, partial [Clostridia bacterium]|nr:OB-fold nucleic acid binding domain-containing protein [Clostridia bacterium]